MSNAASAVLASTPAAAAPAPQSPWPEDAGTSRSRRIWSAGDYDRISAGFRHEAQAFIERLALRNGERVLDAACGSGNLTIPAARTGAQVTGLDIVPELLDQAGAWAARERVPVKLDAGTVEALPYADASFDRVVSMFGVMFAARPESVVSELARVTRPGGEVALANWTREGFIGAMLAAHVAFAPPPAGVPSTLLWGDEQVMRERFPAHLWEVRFTRRTLTFRYPHSPAGTAELFRGAYGPTVRTFEAIDEDARVRFATRLRELWESRAAAQVIGTIVESEYLEMVATRR